MTQRIVIHEFNLFCRYIEFLLICILVSWNESFISITESVTHSIIAKTCFIVRGLLVAQYFIQNCLVFVPRHNSTFLRFAQISSFFRYKNSSFCAFCFVSNSFFSYVSSIDFFSTRRFSSSLLILLCAQFKCSSKFFCNILLAYP